MVSGSMQHSPFYQPSGKAVEEARHCLSEWTWFKCLLIVPECVARAFITVRGPRVWHKKHVYLAVTMPTSNCLCNQLGGALQHAWQLTHPLFKNSLNWLYGMTSYATKWMKLWPWHGLEDQKHLEVSHLIVSTGMQYGARLLQPSIMGKTGIPKTWFFKKNNLTILEENEWPLFVSLE